MGESRGPGSVDQILLQRVLLFENMHDGVIITDLGGKITDWNKGAERMFGYARSEVLGRAPSFLHRPEDEPALSTEIADRLNDLGRWEREVEFVRKDGTGGTCESVVLPLQDKSGNPLAFVGIHHDITERKRSEEAIRSSEELFRTIVTHAQPIIFMIDRDGTFHLSEGKMLASIGLKPGEVVGRSAFEMYKDYPVIIREMNLALAGQLVEDTVEVNGVFFDIFFSPYRDAEGNVSGLIGMAVDVTERTRNRTRTQGGGAA